MLDKTNYYAPTAFDSTNIRPMPPRIPAEKFTYAVRKMRQNLIPWGVFLKDQRVFVKSYMIHDLRKGKYDNRIGLNEAIYELASFKNPWVSIDALQRLTGIFTVAGLILNIAVAIGKPHLISLTGWMFFFIPFTLFLLLTWLKHYTHYRNNYFFNRRTGMVILPKGKDRGACIFPFDEADAYICSNHNKNGFIEYSLKICHRYSTAFIVAASSEINEQACNVRWEFIQHFMDISKPVPDIPQLEPYRHLDPVTAQYDKEHNRPKDYWRNKDPKEVDKEFKEANKRGMKFPFGAMYDKMAPHLTADPLPGVQETPTISQEELNAMLEPYKKYKNIH
jgi:hypothetical protein